jgi:hypothetical protein
MTFLE